MKLREGSLPALVPSVSCLCWRCPHTGPVSGPPSAASEEETEEAQQLSSGSVDKISANVEDCFRGNYDTLTLRKGVKKQ